MCFGGGDSRTVYVPDTSGQEAELRRQLDALTQEFARNRAQQETFYNETRAQEDARYNQQRADMLAENERMRALLQGQIDAETAARQALEARAEEERVAREQAAADRASRVREYSEGRQSAIDSTVAAVNSAYAGFDDPFFQKFREDYIAAFQPQLRQEYQDADKQEQFALQRKGLLGRGSGSATALARLRGQAQAREGELSNEADSAVGAFRDQVASQRANTLSGVLQSAFVGNEDLPDGVTDVSGQLGNITRNVEQYLGGVGDSIRALSPSSFVRNPNLSPLKTSVSAPRAKQFGSLSTSMVGGGGSNRASSFFVR